MIQLVAQRAIHFGRLRVAPQRFGAVGIVDRRRRADQIGAGPFGQQAEPGGRGQRFIVLVQHVPNLRPLDHVVPGRPHFDLVLLPPIKSVGHDTVFPRHFAGRHVGLHRAGDAGKAGHQVGRVAPLGQPLERRHPLDVAFAQAGNRQQNHMIGHDKLLK